MKETRFIAQNKEKWLESETVLQEEIKDPEKLSNLFTQVVDDLSYSRTYYPNRSVRLYLNSIAREYFSIIYSNRKERKNRFRFFWMDELPQIVIFCKTPLLISLFVFLLSAAIGVFSSMKDPQFTSSILSEGYVAMTKANIEKGDPMAVYKKSHQVDMFLGITLNNLMVAFRTYVFGVFMSIGTLAILLYNGIMVGCFQYFFIERNLFAESALTIWLHGTLEISSIIIAGGAGLTLGSGLIFPGTYSRLQAFQLSAIRSLKLMIGITPIFVMAGLIESFLTRYTDVPDILRLFLILLSAFFIVGYFVVYPWMKSRSGFEFPLEEIKLPPSIDEPTVYDKIKNNGEIIKDSFILYKRYFNKIVPYIFATALIVAATDLLFTLERGPIRYELDALQYLFNDLYYALKTPYPLFILINGLACAVIVYRSNRFFVEDAAKSSQKRFRLQPFLQAFVITTSIFAILYYLEGWGDFLLIFSFLLFIIYSFAQHFERSNLINSLSSGWNKIAANFWQVIGLQLILLTMSFSFLLVLSAPLLYLNTEVIQWNFAETDEWAKKTIQFIETFAKLFGFYLVLPLLCAAASSLYFSLQEILTAGHLKKSIAAISPRNAKSSKR